MTSRNQIWVRLGAVLGLVLTMAWPAETSAQRRRAHGRSRSPSATRRVNPQSRSRVRQGHRSRGAVKQRSNHSSRPRASRPVRVRSRSSQRSARPVRRPRAGKASRSSQPARRFVSPSTRGRRQANPGLQRAGRPSRQLKNTKKNTLVSRPTRRQHDRPKVSQSRRPSRPQQNKKFLTVANPRRRPAPQQKTVRSSDLAMFSTQKQLGAGAAGAVARAVATRRHGTTFTTTPRVRDLVSENIRSQSGLNVSVNLGRNYNQPVYTYNQPAYSPSCYRPRPTSYVVQSADNFVGVSVGVGSFNLGFSYVDYDDDYGLAYTSDPYGYDHDWPSSYSVHYSGYPTYHHVRPHFWHRWWDWDHGYNNWALSPWACQTYAPVYYNSW